MRISLLLSAVPLLTLGLASVSFADTVQQTITGLDETLGDGTPYDINAVPFDPSLGTLTDVSVELIGTYTPSIAIDVIPGPVPATATLTSHVFAFATLGGATVTDPLGSQILPTTVGVTQQNLTGAPTPMDSTFDLTDLSSFEPGNLTPQLLVEYGVRTSSDLVGSGDSDLTSFEGKAILTYTYTAIPEPTTALVLGMGLLGLAWSRRRSAQ